jgi:GT2 family glycosyltransferase
VIENKRNLGFARAFNEQIKMKLNQGYDGIIMMNSDVCVDDPFFINKMVDTLFRDDRIALVQPKIYVYNIQKEKIINTLGNCVHYLGFGYVDRIDEVDNTDQSDKQIVSASGACLFIKKEFFAYMEDIDLSWRAYLMGYRVYLCGSTYLWHKYKYKRNDAWLCKMNAIERNRYFTLVKNYSNKTLLFLLPALMLIDFGVLFYSITQGWFKEKIKVYFQVIKNLRMMMIKKRNIQLKRKITDKEMMINFSDSIDTILLKNPILDVFNHFFVLYYNVMIKFL